MFDRWNSRCRLCDYSDVGAEITARADRSLEYLDALQLNRPTILEIGCGTGWLTTRLCEVGSVWACDLSPLSIEYAVSRGLDAAFVPGNALELEMPEANVAFVFDTLFYVEDQAKLIGMLADRVEWLIISNINAWVYERCAEVIGPEPGQYRHWLSIRETRQLLEPWYDVLKLQTVYPFRGNQGVLRLIQSYKLNRLFAWLPLERIKNALMLGAGVVILARRRQT